MERLVGFGCDLDISDEDGDTPLHMALAKITTNPLSDETPQLKKVVHFTFLSLRKGRRAGEGGKGIERRGREGEREGENKREERCSI